MSLTIEPQAAFAPAVPIAGRCASRLSCVEVHRSILTILESSWIRVKLVWHPWCIPECIGPWWCGVWPGFWPSCASWRQDMLLKNEIVSQVSPPAGQRPKCLEGKETQNTVLQTRISEWFLPTFASARHCGFTSNSTKFIYQFLNTTAKCCQHSESSSNGKQLQICLGAFFVLICHDLAILSKTKLPPSWHFFARLGKHAPFLQHTAASDVDWPWNLPSCHQKCKCSGRWTYLAIPTSHNQIRVFFSLSITFSQIFHSTLTGPSHYLLWPWQSFVASWSFSFSLRFSSPSHHLNESLVIPNCLWTHSTLGNLG